MTVVLHQVSLARLGREETEGRSVWHREGVPSASRHVRTSERAASVYALIVFSSQVQFHLKRENGRSQVPFPWPWGQAEWGAPGGPLRPCSPAGSTSCFLGARASAQRSSWP